LLSEFCAGIQQDLRFWFLFRLFFFGSLILVVVFLVSLFLNLFFIFFTALVSHFWPPVDACLILAGWRSNGDEIITFLDYTRVKSIQQNSIFIKRLP